MKPVDVVTMTVAEFNTFAKGKIVQGLVANIKAQQEALASYVSKLSPEEKTIIAKQFPKLRRRLK